MTLVKDDVFVCLDCESTGLDVDNDRIIEIAIVKFTFSKIIDSFESLIDPEREIPEESRKIHNISSEMVKDKPKIKTILPEIYKIANEHTIVGHGISFDLNLMYSEATRHSLDFPLKKSRSIDTLRLARLYGECPANSLENLRKHFNIAEEGAHRAMSDVLVNIAVFKQLAKTFKTTDDIFKRLEKPVMLKTMPLGKHKGRKFSEIPAEYLKWIVRQDFDMDLIYSIKTELRKRNQDDSFSKASNPFNNL